MKLWVDFLTAVEDKLGKKTVDEWLTPLRILKFDARNLHLEARDTFQILWFHEHAIPLANELLLQADGTPLTLHFYLEGKPWKKENKAKDLPDQASTFSADPLEPHATFSRFVEVDGDNLALSILQELDMSYNPIYIYGPKGSGKSHLLMATAQKLIDSGTRAFYVKSETFSEHVVRAFRTSTLQEFRSTYRDIGALLIDDVHLFSRKIATQEEFFHTFNRLHTSGYPIILAAECAPRFLQDIEERLVSRFEWGLTLPLNTPSEKVREQILKEKMAELSLTMSPDLCHYLLKTFSQLPSLIRAAEALALRSSSQTSSSIDLEVALVLLKDLIEEEEKVMLSPEKIVKVVAHTFGIKPEDILGKSQQKECVFPRQIAMYLCRKELSLSFLKIGKVFSRDHSTVMSSVKLIEKGASQKDEHIINSLRNTHRHLS